MIYSDKILEDTELVVTVKCVIDRINMEWKWYGVKK